MGKWEMVRLGDAASFNMGQSPSSDSYNSTGKGLPFFQGKTDFGLMYPTVRMYCTEPKKIADKYDILISVRAPVGTVNIATESCCIGRGLAAITQKESISDFKYLYYYLQYKENDIARMGVGSTFKAISKKDLDAIEIPLPPLPTQQKIADILDRAGALIEKSKAQIEKLDLLVKSQFIEMFGDPVTNPMGWEVRLFSDIAIVDTKMTTDFDKYADMPHIGIDSIEKDTGELINYRFVKDSGLISGKYIFDDRHIIYSKIRPNLNKVALPSFIGLCSADAYPVLPNAENCNRIFLAMIMRSDVFLHQILAQSSRTNIPKVNKQQLLSVKMPIPPLALQTQFAAFVERVEAQKAKMKQGLELMELEYKSLMQECFKGELF